MGIQCMRRVISKKRHQTRTLSTQGLHTEIFLVEMLIGWCGETLGKMLSLVLYCKGVKEPPLL